MAPLHPLPSYLVWTILPSVWRRMSKKICPSDLQLSKVRCYSRSGGQCSGWAIGRMGSRADQHYPVWTHNFLNHLVVWTIARGTTSSSSSDQKFKKKTFCAHLKFFLLIWTIKNNSSIEPKINMYRWIPNIWIHSKSFYNVVLHI